MKYKSCAEWPAHVFTAADGSHTSTDMHDSKEAANAVCGMLARHGFGGHGERPMRTWVEVVSNG